MTSFYDIANCINHRSVMLTRGETDFYDEEELARMGFYGFTVLALETTIFVLIKLIFTCV